MADETRSGPFTATEEPNARASYGGATQPGSAPGTGTAGAQPGSAEATGPTGAQAPQGGGFPLPVPSLPFGVDPKKALWWGGLAALAAVEIIEWPVAAVVGVGSYVAERWAREDARRSAKQPS
jgi:hypothetical protein